MSSPGPPSESPESPLNEALTRRPHGAHAGPYRENGIPESDDPDATEPVYVPRAILAEFRAAKEMCIDLAARSRAAEAEATELRQALASARERIARAQAALETAFGRAAETVVVGRFPP